jgi:hypothetical protein
MLTFNLFAHEFYMFEQCLWLLIHCVPVPDCSVSCGTDEILHTVCFTFEIFH